MPKEVLARLQGLAGGVNARDAPNQIAGDEAVAILNMVLDERGGAGKRRGSTLKASLGGRALSLYTFYRPGLEPQLIAHFSDGTLKYSVDPFTVWTNIATGLSTSEPFSFETFAGKVYMSNGVDDYRSWDGAATATFPSAPKGKFLKVWKDTMWVGIPPDRIYSSDAGNAEVFGVSSWVDVGKGDGDELRALHTDGSVLIVWKQRRTFVVYDPVEFSNRVADFEKGAESHFSVIDHEGDIYFLSRRGICVYQGDAPSVVISEKLDPIFTEDILNINALQTAWAYVIENRVGWSLPEVGQTVPTLQIEHYPRLPKKPFTFHRIPAGCFARVRRGSTEKLYYGKTSGNKILLAFDGGTEDSASFYGMVETGWFDMQAPFNQKYLREIRVLGRGKFFVGVRRNFEPAIVKSLLIDLTGDEELWNEPGDTWNNGTWGPTAQVKEVPKGVDTYGKFFSFRISDAETTSGSRPIDVGDQDYRVPAGQFSIYGLLANGAVMGTHQ